MNNYQLSVIDRQLSSAYFLVVHGSRNPLYGKQLHQLVNDIQLQLYAQEISIFLDTAYLELASKPLHQKIISFAQESAIKGYQSVRVLPLFLLSGTHVINDIPQEFSLACGDSPLPLELLPNIGTSIDLINLLRSQFEGANTSDRILLAHGTSLPEANQELEEVAAQLQARVAYWSREPQIDTVVNDLIVSEVKSIAVLPYFLFTGKITDAIESQISDLQDKATTKIVVLPTLAQINQFIKIVIDNL